MKNISNYYNRGIISSVRINSSNPDYSSIFINYKLLRLIDAKLKCKTIPFAPYKVKTSLNVPPKIIKMRKFYADQIISVVVGYLIDYNPSVFLNHESSFRRIDN